MESYWNCINIILILSKSYWSISYYFVLGCITITIFFHDYCGGGTCQLIPHEQHDEQAKLLYPTNLNLKPKRT